MSNDTLDVYVNERLVGTLIEHAGGCVFTYLPDVPADSFVSLLMPVRADAGLSGTRGKRAKEKNPYVNQDGPFNHKSR
jgi:hypothetical protein